MMGDSGLLPAILRLRRLVFVLVLVEDEGALSRERDDRESMLEELEPPLCVTRMAVARVRPKPKSLVPGELLMVMVLLVVIVKVMMSVSLMMIVWAKVALLSVEVVVLTLMSILMSIFWCGVKENVYFCMWPHYSPRHAQIKRYICKYPCMHPHTVQLRSVYT